MEKHNYETINEFMLVLEMKHTMIEGFNRVYFRILSRKPLYKFQ